MRFEGNPVVAIIVRVWWRVTGREERRKGWVDDRINEVHGREGEDERNESGGQEDGSRHFEQLSLQGLNAPRRGDHEVEVEEVGRRDLAISTSPAPVFRPPLPLSPRCRGPWVLLADAPIMK